MAGDFAEQCLKGHNGDDIPFNKLSQGALCEVTCGWFREAIIWKKTSRAKKFAIQATTLCDKKQFFFFTQTKLDNQNVWKSNAMSKGKSKKSQFNPLNHSLIMSQTTVESIKTIKTVQNIQQPSKLITGTYAYSFGYLIESFICFIQLSFTWHPSILVGRKTLERTMVVLNFKKTLECSY